MKNDLPGNFTLSVSEAVNDQRAAITAIALLLCEKGILTVEEIMSKKASILAEHDQSEAKAREEFSSLIRKIAKERQ